jgi:hypothetical protein
VGCWIGGFRRLMSLRTATGILALLAGLGCTPAASVPSPASPRARPGVAAYDGVVTIDPARGTLRARWRIALAPTALVGDSATFLLNDGLAVARVVGPSVVGFGRALKSDLQQIVVRFQENARTRASNDVEIEYAGTPSFSEDSINGLRRDWVELGLDSFWQPIVEGYAESIVARVRIVLPSGWQMAASGRVTRAGDTLVLSNDVPLIDVAFAAAPVLRRTAEGTVAVHHVDSADVLVPKVQRAATSCARYLGARYGAAAPLPPVDIAVAPRGGPGYARKNYIVITRVADTATLALQRFVCHELAHYWSTGAVASGPENWINEAFAEFVSARYVREVSGDSAYRAIVASWRERSTNSPPIWTPGATARPGPRVSYGKAPLLLHRLEERVSAATMDRILVRYMGDPTLRTTERLAGMIGEVTGVETERWLRAQLAA